VPEKLIAALIDLVLGVLVFITARICMGVGKLLLIKFRTRKSVEA
jgi:hypothetical protein